MATVSPTKRTTCSASSGRGGLYEFGTSHGVSSAFRLRSRAV